MGGSKIPLLAVLLIVAAVAGYFMYAPKPAPPAEPVLTADARQYLDQLALSDVEMQAADSYMKMSLTEITGKITNKGPRTINLVQVVCVFRDVNRQVIKRERVTIAGPKTGPLNSGATKSFHLNFDDIPQNWNQTVPDLVIAQIQFG